MLTNIHVSCDYSRDCHSALVNSLCSRYVRNIRDFILVEVFQDKKLCCRTDCDREKNLSKGILTEESCLFMAIVLNIDLHATARAEK